MKFVLATHNIEKEKEMQAILQPLGIEVQTAKNAGFELPEIVEDTDTFEGNAMKKAVQTCKALGVPVIADDSGLAVTALSGKPGVYSARFAGERATSDDNNKKLLFDMQNVPDEKREAKFVCVICCAFPNGDTLTSYGEVCGMIGMTKSGVAGFGYDPLFYVDGVSFADMPADEKNKISHRYNAGVAFAKELADYLNGIA